MALAIRLEPKRRKEESRPLLTVVDELDGPPLGVLVGSNVIVDDPASVLHLYDNGFYGQALGNRMNFFNEACFTPDDELADDCPDRKRPRLTTNAVSTVLNTSFIIDPHENKKGEHEIIKPVAMPTAEATLEDVVEPLETTIREEAVQVAARTAGARWLATMNARTHGRFFLSPHEALYLLKNDRLRVAGHTIDTLWRFYLQQQDAKTFARRFFTYAHFRNHGWTVKTAINFAGDFMLYKESPEHYHASIVVRIVDDYPSPASLAMIALQREIKNVKKAIYLVQFDPRSDSEWAELGHDDYKTVKLHIFHSVSSTMCKRLTDKEDE